jgi:hypothetical protein
MLPLSHTCTFLLFRVVFRQNEIPFHQQLQPADDDQSVPGEWDEFDKVQPMDKGADAIGDNPENAGDDKSSLKKEVQMPLDGLSAQTFKVKAKTSLPQDGNS